MGELKRYRNDNFLIENLENYAIEIALDSEVYVVEKQSTLAVSTCVGKKKLSASCFGTAYADCIPERWQKNSDIYEILIETDKQYICQCRVYTKPMFLGMFRHVMEVKLNIIGRNITANSTPVK
jgi:hypothetical protein